MGSAWIGPLTCLSMWEHRHVHSRHHFGVQLAPRSSCCSYSIQVLPATTSVQSHINCVG